MPVRFLYSGDFGLRIDADENEELTESQATIVAIRDLAAAMSSLGERTLGFSRRICKQRFLRSRRRWTDRRGADTPQAQNAPRAKLKKSDPARAHAAKGEAQWYSR